jgi:hypothetical protein
MAPQTSQAAIKHAAKLALMALERIARENAQLSQPVDSSGHPPR